MTEMLAYCRLKGSSRTSIKPVNILFELPKNGLQIKPNDIGAKHRGKRIKIY